MHNLSSGNNIKAVQTILACRIGSAVHTPQVSYNLHLSESPTEYVQLCRGRLLCCAPVHLNVNTQGSNDTLGNLELRAVAGVHYERRAAIHLHTKPHTFILIAAGNNACTDHARETPELLGFGHC